MTDEGIDKDKVAHCIENSFEKKGDTKSGNKLLAEDREWATRLGIVIHPSLTINNITYRGDLNGFDIFKAVCAGFKDVPDKCRGDNVFALVKEEEAT